VVLEATAHLPTARWTSYAGIARQIGAPRATRAVAQALRHNPLPIVVPCHRVIGSRGDLTGYAGTRIGLKRDLLAVEGVHTVAGRGDYHVDRRAVYYKYLDGGEYCLPTCGGILEKPLGEFTVFGSRARAEAVGLQPCSDLPARSASASRLTAPVHPAPSPSAVARSFHIPLPPVSHP
jgi:O-6-methylguanine DNA methyltransferase